MIGAHPRTDWLPPELQRDAEGFLVTGTDLARDHGWPLERSPYLLETSMPGVFAAGDVRHGAGNGSLLPSGRARSRSSCCINSSQPSSDSHGAVRASRWLSPDRPEISSTHFGSSTGSSSSPRWPRRLYSTATATISTVLCTRTCCLPTGGVREPSGAKPCLGDTLNGQPIGCHFRIAASRSRSRSRQIDVRTSPPMRPTEHVVGRGLPLKAVPRTRIRSCRSGRVCRGELPSFGASFCARPQRHLWDARAEVVASRMRVRRSKSGPPLQRCYCEPRTPSCWSNSMPLHSCQCSTALPPSKRTMSIPVTTIVLFVGGTPMNSPVWVPRIVNRAATRSPSPITSSAVNTTSGKAVLMAPTICFTPSRSLVGLPRSWLTNSAP